jgi:phage terminase large subunit GpA-like protein
MYLSTAQIAARADSLDTAFLPPPNETVSEWTDNFRYTERGKYYVALAEYQRAPMDAISDPLVEEVVLMWSVQTGKTELILNTVGRFAHREPCPMMWVLPTIEQAKNISKQRLDPMFEQTKELNGLLADKRKRDANNALTFKKFPGGFITMPGANSPVSLSSWPIRLLVGDEIDRWGRLIKGEGDILMLARKRTTSFSDRKMVWVSSPTERETSRIYPAYMETNQQQYYLPCPHCGGLQVLRFPNLKFEYDQTAIKDLVRDDDESEEFDYRKKAIAEHIHAYFVCEHCGTVIEHEHKQEMVQNGVWKAKYPKIVKRQGFHIWQAYSPFVTWAETAAEFLHCSDYPDRLRVFTNTVLGELYEEKGQRIDENPLMQRRERYPERLPEKIEVITVGVDVQGDRLEAEIIGWAADGENWSLDYRVLWGNTAMFTGGPEDVYTQLYAILEREYVRDDGSILTIDGLAIDTGYNQEQVFDWCEEAGKLYRIFPVKGASTSLGGVISKQTRAGSRRLKLWMVDGDAAKNILLKRLAIEPGEKGSAHFPEHYDRAYFMGLTAEEQKTRGEKRVWVKVRERNEPIDTRVYSYAAMRILSPAWGQIRRRMTAELQQESPESEENRENRPILKKKVVKKLKFGRMR